jgi:hypothetical protein
MSEKDLSAISKKLNVLISLSMRSLTGDKHLGTKLKGVGELARYLADMQLDPKDIAEILSSPLSSVRSLLTPKRRG